MSGTRKASPYASVADKGTDGRMFAPAADRNREAIVALVREAGRPQGRALEIASGTGEHVVALAAALPDLTWQPSDIDPERLASIGAHLAASGVSNVSAPVVLDAVTPGWGVRHAGQDMILVVNLLHLISEDQAQVVLTEAARALSPRGRLIVYGPFMRDEDLTSEGDRAFHAALIAADPAIGYKSDFDVIDWGIEAGLDVAAVVEMPANNLALVWEKPGF